MTKETMEELKQFNPSQMHTIARGINCSLTLDEINLFAKPDIKSECMQIICDELVENKIGALAVSHFVDPKFEKDQLIAIFQSFNCKLSLDDILIFGRIEFSAEQMKQIRIGLITLSRKDTLLFANPKFTPNVMHIIRLMIEKKEKSMDEIESYVALKVLEQE